MVVYVIPHQVESRLNVNRKKVTVLNSENVNQKESLKLIALCNISLMGCPALASSRPSDLRTGSTKNQSRNLFSRRLMSARATTLASGGTIDAGTYVIFVGRVCLLCSVKAVYRRESERQTQIPPRYNDLRPSISAIWSLYLLKSCGLRPLIMSQNRCCEIFTPFSFSSWSAIFFSSMPNLRARSLILMSIGIFDFPIISLGGLRYGYHQ